MARTDSIFRELTAEELEKIRGAATLRKYKRGDLVFSEGDIADYIYFIESGKVSVYIQKFAVQEEICVLGRGEYFGEMAFFLNDKRTASVSAVNDAILLCVDKEQFLGIINNDRTFADKIKRLLARRNEELFLKENLVNVTGIKGSNFHVAIKGDPSMRETTFTRERYESVVDKVLPRLQPRLEELLINRCIYQVFVGFNNGEVRLSSVFDPFSEEMHSAVKLTDGAYVDRHFPVIAYMEKADMLKRLYDHISSDPLFCKLPEQFRNVFDRSFSSWRPVEPSDISKTLSRLSSLRSIPNYYLRNFSISMVRDVIRMQFNCDGTHIVGSEDYQRFIDENL